MYLLKTILDNKRKNHESLYTATLDIKQAFPSMWREGAAHIAYNKGLRGKPWRILYHLAQNTNYNVKIGDCFSKFKFFENGTRQGVSAPMIFKNVISKLLEKLDEANVGPKVGSLRVHTLAYADDLLLLAESPDVKIFLNRGDLFSIRKM